MHEISERSSPAPDDLGARELRDPAPDADREFEAIYRREFPVALRFARRYVDDATAEDVVQAVFTRYWEGYTRTPALVFRADHERTQTAILTAVRNEMRMLRRRARTWTRKTAFVRAGVVALLRDAAAPERPQADAELSEVIARALEQLPTRQREVFALVKFDEKSYAEAAEILGVSPKTVHQHLVKANARLRRILSDYRIPEPDWSHILYDENVRDGRKDAQP